MARTKDPNSVDLELRRTWHGADGHREKATELNVWRLYHLMAGGIESVYHLARLSGLSRNKIDTIDLRRLWLSADNTWHRVREAIVTIELPTGCLVRCRRCSLVTGRVPCSNGCPQDFLNHRQPEEAK